MNWIGKFNITETPGDGINEPFCSCAVGCIFNVVFCELWHASRLNMEPFVPEMLKRRLTEFICCLRKGLVAPREAIYKVEG